MARTTLSPALSDDWLSFIDSQVGQEGYDTADDYVQAMLRREREIARVRALLFEGRDSGPAEPIDEAYWERQRERIRRHARKSA